jgi:hypothetical protein
MMVRSPVNAIGAFGRRPSQASAAEATVWRSAAQMQAAPVRAARDPDVFRSTSSDEVSSPVGRRSAEIGPRCHQCNVQGIATVRAFRARHSGEVGAVSCLSMGSRTELTGSGKQPYLIGIRDASPLELPAVGARKNPEEGEVRANIHDPQHDAQGALRDDPEGMADVARRGYATRQRLLGMPRAHLSSLMWVYPVNRRVGNVRNNDAALLDEISVAA